MPEHKPESDDAQRPRGRGRPPKLSPEQMQELVALSRSHATIGTDDLIDAYRRKTGVVLSRGTVLKYLREAGLTRARVAGERSSARRPEPPADAASVAPAAPPAAPPSGGEGKTGADEMSPVRATSDERRQRHDASYRDPGEVNRHPSGLTDAEWAVVKELFDKPGPGRPSQHDRREMLDACVYVLRTGCSWRMLPKTFPSWTNVYSTFRRWSAQGLFERMYELLRELWRHREGRDMEPTAGRPASSSSAGAGSSNAAAAGTRRPIG